MPRFLRSIAESGPTTRSKSRNRSRSGNRPRSASRGRTASRNRSANGTGTRKRPRNGPVTRTMNAAMNAVRSVARRITRARRPRRNVQMVPQIFNPIARQGAEEGYNSNKTDKTQTYSENNVNFTNFNEPRGPLLRSNSAHLDPQPLERKLSAAERQRLAQVSGSDLLDEAPPSPQLERFYSAAGAENMPPLNPNQLERFVSVNQSPLRFVLYTSDRDLFERFIDGTHLINIRYNSERSVPLTPVFLNRVSFEQRAQIRSRLPASVQHLSQEFTESQFKNSITLPHYFLLTVEHDTRTNGPDDRLEEPPTGPIYGVLCCSEETATRNSTDFIDSSGTPLINFDIFANSTRYIYVHLFTFLSDRTVGHHFFTGSLMLEGLYDLFNPRGHNERIIYLEAITVPATIQFYERFGMKKLNQIVLRKPGSPSISIHFDPFIGAIVPSEVPYVLTDARQIQEAAEIAQGRRHATRNATGQRLQASIDLTRLRQPTTEEIRRLEADVFQFFLEKARQDPFEPPLSIHRGP
jgi:hypothetical protein